MENKVAIVTVLYNVANLLTKQVECIRKFCKDDFDIIIIDNSNQTDKIDSIKYYADQLGVNIIKVFSSESAGSKSNACACNVGYAKLKKSYGFFLFIDHDTFPIRDFSVIETLDGRIMAGLGQVKSKKYFQQTSLMWNNNVIDKKLIDFSVNGELALDTGGNLYKVIEHYGEDKCGFFNEKYYQNPYFPDGFYNFYVTVNDDMFMHFVNASDWNPTKGNEERINSLINILNKRIEA